MQSGFALRTLSAVIVAILAAAGVFAVDGQIEGALLALVGGAAGALIAAGTGDEPPARPAPAIVPSPSPPPVEDLLEAIAQPMLLIEGGRVLAANRAALALLGRHIVGGDVRLAIRHPAAAERLADASAPLPDRPVELVGIGTLDQRWEMRIGAIGDHRRLIQLVDQTGNYAAEQMRVDFVANASHELRTPLASILGFIETLDGEAGEEPATRTRFLKVMFDEARRMQRLVQDLISLSRIEAEKYRLPGQSVDLAALLRDVGAEMRDSHGLRGRDVSLGIADDLPPIAGDRPQLSQMLHNLIGNALKYGRAATPVRVALNCDGTGMVRLSVADEGDGIPPEHIPRLTERFYRADAGRSRALGGTGLGLAIVKHIVERHRGRLDIVSQVGIGTTVSVTLPPAGPVPAGSPPPELMSSKRNETVTRPAGQHV